MSKLKRVKPAGWSVVLGDRESWSCVQKIVFNVEIGHNFKTTHLDCAVRVM
jgi:hypothetical protein